MRWRLWTPKLTPGRDGRQVRPTSPRRAKPPTPRAVKAGGKALRRCAAQTPEMGQAEEQPACGQY